MMTPERIAEIQQGHAMFMVELECLAEANDRFVQASFLKHDDRKFEMGKWIHRAAVNLPGDKVKLELSPYDLTRGRIVYRYK